MQKKNKNQVPNRVGFGTQKKEEYFDLFFTVYLEPSSSFYYISNLILVEDADTVYGMISSCPVLVIYFLAEEDFDIVYE